MEIVPKSYLRHKSRSPYSFYRIFKCREKRKRQRLGQRLPPSVPRYSMPSSDLFFKENFSWICLYSLTIKVDSSEVNKGSYSIPSQINLGNIKSVVDA